MLQLWIRTDKLSIQNLANQAQNYLSIKPNPIIATMHCYMMALYSEIMKTKEEFEEKLIVGVKIQFGKQYAKEHYATEGEIITLVDGEFEYDNGLYTENQDCPAIWNEGSKEFDSIYHLFGNNFENWMDNTIVE